MKKRSYDKEFKLHAVKQVLEQGKKQSQVARELDISKVSLSNWLTDYKAHNSEAFVGSGNTRDSEKELKIKDKRIRELEEECEILKKAMGYFAKSQK